MLVNLYLCSKWLTSAKRFEEQAGIKYSTCGRTRAPYNGMKANFESPYNDRLIMKINGLALFAVSVH